MNTHSSVSSIQSIAAAIGQAAAARAAAEQLVIWFQQQERRAIIGLLNTGSATLDLVHSEGVSFATPILDWIQSTESWLLWERWPEAYWLDETTPLPGLEGLTALLVPLRHDGVLYGLLWLEGDPDRATAILLTHLLAARLHYLTVTHRWDTLLTSVNAFSRALWQETTSEQLWQVIHHQIAALFDTSSFYIGLLNNFTSQLTLPLYVENDVQIYYGPMALTGLNRAVIQHGTPLHFRDLNEEPARLAALNVTLDAEEPGQMARSWLGVPLRSRRGEVIGLISLQNLLPNCYADPDLHLLLLIAGQIAFAVENHRLLQAEQERRRVASTLMEVGQVVNSTLHYEEVLERILEQMQRVVDYDSASIMLPAAGCDDGSRMIVAALNGTYPAAKGTELHLGESSPGMLVYQSQQPLVIGDIQQYVGWSDTLPTGTRARSWLGVPMRIQNRVIGLLTLDKASLNYYDETDASTIFALARQAAIAVENARLHAQAESHSRSLEQRNRRLASMHRIATVLSASLERDVVLSTAARLLTELFEADHCGVVLLNTNDHHAYLMAEYPDTGNIGLRIPAQGSAMFEKLARSNEAVAVYNVDSEDEVDEETRTTVQRVGARSSLFAPLVARNQLIGSIGLDMTTNHRIFSTEEQETFMTIAAQVALAINNAQLYEEAITINRLKSELLANMSHELRTPLNAIIGYSEMLLSQVYGDLNPKQLDRLTRVHSGGKHLLSLINDVLDLSRIESGQMTLALAPLSVSDVINDMAAEMQPRAREKGLTLHLQFDTNLPNINADALRVRQIVGNLVDNAIKFTEAGSVTVEVGQTTTGQAVQNFKPPFDLPDGNWLVVRVKDTGIGISAEHQRIIFEAFRQVDSSSVRKYEGTGLGLTLVYQLVRMHQGYIWVESASNQGSTFIILLPVAAAPPAPAVPVTTDPDRPTVLVVDDDPAVLQLVQDYLSDDIYQVVGTTKPEQALELARRLRPAAIITDILMPPINGWEVLRSLKSDKDTAKIPVIILSVIEQKTVGFYLGAADYLIKPITREMLLAALERAARIEPKDPILVVDDNDDDRAFLVELLERAGYPVAQVSSGEAALEWLAAQPTALILLDLKLPGLSGAEVLERLRADPATAVVPVVVVTGADFTADALAALQTPVLQKGGISGNALVQEVQLALNRGLQQRRSKIVRE